MNSKVVDADKNPQAEVDNFNSEVVLEDEQEDNFMQDRVECDMDSEVVCDLQGKYCVFNQKDHNSGNLSDIFLNNLLQFTFVNPQFFTIYILMLEISELI